MPNKELLQKTLAAVEVAAEREGPEGWYQPSYRCNSGMCFAGWATEVSGYEWVNPVPQGNDEEDDLVYVTAEDLRQAKAYLGWDPSDIRNGHSVMPADAVARVKLGLNSHQTGRLFWSDNTLDDLRRQVNELVVAEDE